MFPTGNLVDDLEVPEAVVKGGILKATMISAGIPTVFVNAADIGYTGTELQDAINQVNATVSHAEGIKKFYILESDLTEEENELTPTMKVKRNVVSQRYAAAIEHLYKR